MEIFKKQNLFKVNFKRNPEIIWKNVLAENEQEADLVELRVENTGFFNEIAQRFFHTPHYSFIKLDALGSAVWFALEERSDILSISEIIEQKFGEKASPLLPRLGRFFQILLDNNLIKIFDIEER